MSTPWYLTPEVLDILAVIRDKPLGVRTCREDYGRVRESWQCFDDVFVSSLEAWREAVGANSTTWACDVAAAASGMRLIGTHFLSDEQGLLMLRDRIDAALDARVVRVAA